MRTGISLISEERNNQISQFDEEHDSQWDMYELLSAAVWYALYGTHLNHRMPVWPWPEFPPSKDIYQDPIRKLAVAGALIAAELDRTIMARSMDIYNKAAAEMREDVPSETKWEKPKDWAKGGESVSSASLIAETEAAQKKSGGLLERFDPEHPHPQFVEAMADIARAIPDYIAKLESENSRFDIALYNIKFILYNADLSAYEKVKEIKDVVRPLA